MKRVFLAAFIGVIFFLCAHKPASALAEFCPATLEYQAVGQSEGSTSPSATYGLQLHAPATRVITSAKLALDTDAGWYTVTISDVHLGQRQQHYSFDARPHAGVFNFVHSEYASPVMYVQFSAPLTVRHAWVDSVSNDGDGNFTCSPARGRSADQQYKKQEQWKGLQLDPADAAILSAPPFATAPRLIPTKTAPLQTSACIEPFRDATITTQAPVDYPFEYGHESDAFSIVEVDIDRDGTIQNARIWDSSGWPAADRAALRAARQSTYRGARAYCQAVPGTYRFIATWSGLP